MSHALTRHAEQLEIFQDFDRKDCDLLIRAAQNQIEYAEREGAKVNHPSLKKYWAFKASMLREELEMLIQAAAEYDDLARRGIAIPLATKPQ